MIILKFEETNSHNQRYVRTVRVEASSQGEVEEIMGVVTNGSGRHPRFIEVGDREPDHFSEAGGFCTRLISALDEGGIDRRDWFEDWCVV